MKKLLCFLGFHKFVTDKKYCQRTIGCHGRNKKKWTPLTEEQIHLGALAELERDDIIGTITMNQKRRDVGLPPVDYPKKRIK